MQSATVQHLGSKISQKAWIVQGAWYCRRADSSLQNTQIITGVCVLRSAKSPGRNRQNFYILFLGEAMRSPYKSLVTYNCIVYNEDTLRYVYAKFEEKLQKSIWIKQKNLKYTRFRLQMTSGGLKCVNQIYISCAVTVPYGICICQIL